MSGTTNTQGIGENEFGEETTDLIASYDAIEIAKKTNFEDINPQYKAFALEFLINGFDHRSAAAKVGFSPNSGMRLRRTPFVAAYINYLQEKNVETFVVSQTFIDAKLDDLYDMAIGDVAVPFVDKEGSEFSAKKFHGDLALSIIKTKSEMHGHIKAPQEGGNGSVTVNIDFGAATGQTPKIVEGVTIDAK